MELEAEVQAVRNTFDAFVNAVKGADFTSYLKLHSEEVVGDVSEELFVKNSERAKNHGFAFDLEKIDLWISKGAQLSERVSGHVKEAKLSPEELAAKRRCCSQAQRKHQAR